jgi:uncharacterized protein (DUF2141 family)
MLIKKIILAVTGTFLLLPTLCQAELPALSVFIENANPATGSVEISLFNSAETFMKEPFLQQSGVVNEDGSYEALFSSLPEGEYALVIVQDENDNGKLDNGFLGFGGESFVFSNNASAWFGWPDFDDAKFQVEKTMRVDFNLE